MELSTTLRPRKVPMEVLVLGLCRTGTLSMKTALEELGYVGVYHMSAVLKNPPDVNLWNEALEFKYKGKGEPWTVEKWDNLLGEYQAVSDIPASIFAEELIAAYPDAKIILTTRSTDSWLNSMMNTIFANRGRNFLWDRICRTFGPTTSFGHMVDLMFENFFLNDFPRFGRRVFMEHNERVRRISPPERFLEFEAKDGWAPLCGFLGRDIPDHPYPRVNDTNAFRATFRVQEQRTKSIVYSVGVVVVPLALAAAFIWRRR